MGIDHVGGCGHAAELSGTPRHPAVEPGLPHTSKEAREKSLTRSSRPPGLGDAAGRRHHAIASASGGLDQGGHLAVAAIESDQTPGVEYQTHSGRAPPASPGGTGEQPPSRFQLGVGQRTELVLP